MARRGVAGIFGLVLTVATAWSLEAGADNDKDKDKGEKIATPTDSKWSLREREQWKKLAAELDERVERANKVCGHKIAVSFAFDTFKGHFVDDSSFGLDGYGRSHAAAPLGALEEICNGNELGKLHIRSKITKIELRWGGDVSSMKLDGTTLVCSLNPKGKDNASTYQSNLITQIKGLPGAPSGPKNAKGIPTPGEGAWSLREREQWNRLATSHQERLERLNKACGSTIAVEFAFDTFKGHFTNDSSFGLDGYGRSHAEAPLGAIEEICRGGDMQKQAIQSKIRRIEIRWLGTGTSSSSLDGTSLIAKISPQGSDNASTFQSNMVKDLKNKL
jgi:hypothetical protein